MSETATLASGVSQDSQPSRRVRDTARVTREV